MYKILQQKKLAGKWETEMEISVYKTDPHLLFNYINSIIQYFLHRSLNTCEKKQFWNDKKYELPDWRIILG